VRFDEVEFARGPWKSVEVRAKSAGKGALEIRMGKPDGPVIARVKLGKTSEWKLSRAAAKGITAGVHDLIVTRVEDEPVEVDWISFR
jgi:hypothetical protein